MATSQNTILTNVLDKLDNMPIAFNITDTDIMPALDDTLREMNIQLSSVDANSTTEFYIEIRTEYWMLHRFENSQSLDFKYSTSIDGRTVDKTMIPEIIKKTMDDLDSKFSKWHATRHVGSGGIWNMTQRTATRLTESTSS